MPVSRPWLGPRPPPRPQPRWLLWAGRRSMTSATRPESEAHRSGTTTSRAPRWLAIRRGLDRQGLPAVSRACPGPKPRPTPLGRRTHGPSDPVASLHAAVQRPPLESSSTPFVIGPPSPAWLPGDDGSIKTPAGVPCHANGGDTAGSRGAFRCPGTRPGCNSRRTARVHPEVNMNRASFRPHRSPTLTGGTPRASGGATRPWVTPWSTPFPLRPAQLLRPGCPPQDFRLYAVHTCSRRCFCPRRAPPY